MAGLNFIYGNNFDDSLVKEVVYDTANTITQYGYEPIFKGENLFLYFIGYDDYPISVIENKEYTIVIEGHIYNSISDTECADTVHSLIRSGSTESIIEWLKQQDGDFNIYHISSDECLTIISDILGRVPLFYLNNPDSIKIGGRSIHFIKSFLNNIDYDLNLDKEAIAQILLLHYPFGEKTPYKNILSAGPASLIKVDNGQMYHRKLHEYNFENKNHKNKSIKHNAEKIAKLILETCRRRSQLDGNHIASLSGGKDSRLIAASLDKIECDFTAASFYHDNAWTMQDSKVAQEVVQQLGVDWNLYKSDTNGTNMIELLYRKGGVNYLSLGFMVDFLSKIRNNYSGPIHYYTGDVGDLIDSGWSVYDEFNNTEEAGGWIIDNYKEMSIEDVSNLTGFTHKEIKEFVTNRLDEFPEDSPRSKVEHFLTRERGISLDFHGEDRNRTFFWTHAPLNSRPVMQYLINTPREQKKNYQLYIQVLKSINKEMVDIEYVPYGAPIGSFEHLTKERIYNLIPNQSLAQKYILSYLFDISGYSNEISNYISAQIEKNDEIGSYLEVDRLLEYVDNPDEYSSEIGYSLMTIITLTEYVNKDNTMLDNFKETNF